MSHTSPYLHRIFNDTLEIKHFHLYCGLGGFAAGVNAANPRLGKLQARYRCLGGIDNDPAAIKDFEKLTGAKGTVMDMFSREQYRDFHGKEPPAVWREATPADIRRAAGGEVPDVVFLSAPCKGFSGLLAEGKSKSIKYQALNQLALRGLFLTLEAFKDTEEGLPALWGFENVPRIQSRGRHLLDQITALFRSYGYLVAETTHDCGELGNLGQSRKRFLMVARLAEKIPNFLYEPERHPLRSVGDVIGRFPLPGDVERAGPMHRIPQLQWKTWVRLAFVPAGKDWRALNQLRVEDGFLKDFALMPEHAFERGPFGVNPWDRHADSVRARSLPTNGRSAVADPRTFGHHHGVFGVRPWDAHGPTIQGASRPGNGRFAVADPRAGMDERYPCYGVLRMDQTAGTVTSARSPGQGPYSVADPRCNDGRHNNVFRVVRMGEASPSVTGGAGPSAGGLAVADPRPGVHPTYKQIKYRLCRYDEASGAVVGASSSGMCAYAVADPRREGPQHGKYAVAKFDGPSRTVIGGSTTGQGAFAVSDPRLNIQRDKGDAYLHSRLYGIVPWTKPSFVVSGKARHDNGPNNVADPRLPAATDKLVCYILAEDGTHHRPFTTLENAALQGLVEPEGHLELYGLSDSAWRERIGNAVPKPTGTAIGDEYGKCLLAAHAGETFRLSSTPIWVRPVAIALSVAMPEVMQ